MTNTKEQREEATPPAKGNILVVDDNPANLRLLSGMLVEDGYKVRAVISGPMALTAAQASPPDLVLLDINMPEMDGYQICERLKADPRTREVPVIFISAMDQVEEKVRAFEVGGVDYVAKPFQFQEVAARVQTHLTLKQLRRELQVANDELTQRLLELEARNEELDAFAHTVAHDLKNPLSSLIGYSSLLASQIDQLPAARSSDFLSRMTRTGQRMNNIIEELLLLSSVRKADDVDVAPLEMAEIVNGARERMASLADEYQAAFEMPSQWPVALGRAQWVEEVWANYMSNAVKYGGRPPVVSVGADTQEGGAPAGWIRFWVRDNGAGLSAEEQAALFAPFERLHQVRAEGHGLGLSIVRRIIEKLGGEVGVVSEPGAGPNSGCEFYFTLPAAD
jgi:signal transduction histidine kinase